FELSAACGGGGGGAPSCTDASDAPNTREAAADLGSLSGDHSSPRLHTKGQICAGDTDWFRFALLEQQTDKVKDLSTSVTLTTGSGDNLDLCVYALDATLVGCSRGGGGVEEVVARVADAAAKDDGTTFYVEVVGGWPSGVNDYDLKIRGDID